MNRRTYDGEELNPFRQQPSGVKEHNDLWEVHTTPTTSPGSGSAARTGWITVFWKHLHRAPVPFGELAWDHARRSLGHAATEEELADAVAACSAARAPAPKETGNRR